jgi:uncharacterized protein YjbI with pentapeptide repeats
MKFIEELEKEAEKLNIEFKKHKNGIVISSFENAQLIAKNVKNAIFTNSDKAFLVTEDEYFEMKFIEELEKEAEKLNIEFKKHKNGIVISSFENAQLIAKNVKNAMFTNSDKAFLVTEDESMFL